MDVAGEKDRACYARDQSKQAPLRSCRINEPPSKHEHGPYKSLEQSLAWNTGRKNIGIQDLKAQPRRRLGQRTECGCGERESLRKFLAVHPGEPIIAFSVTRKWYGHQEPKRKPKHRDNEIADRLSPCVWTSHKTVLEFQTLADWIFHLRVIHH